MTAFCKVCHSAGKPEKEYTSHFVRSEPGPNGVVVCPYLLSLVCRYCKQKGHTPKCCPQLVNGKYRNHKDQYQNQQNQQKKEIKEKDGWTTFVPKNSNSNQNVTRTYFNKTDSKSSSSIKNLNPYSLLNNQKETGRDFVKTYSSNISNTKENEIKFAEPVQLQGYWASSKEERQKISEEKKIQEVEYGASSQPEMTSQKNFKDAVQNKTKNPKKEVICVRFASKGDSVTFNEPPPPPPTWNFDKISKWSDEDENEQFLPDEMLPCWNHCNDHM